MVSDIQAKLCDEIFSDLVGIGNDIEENDDIIQALRRDYAKDGEGMSVVIEITLTHPTAKNRNPRVIFSSCFTMIDGYPKKSPIPPNPHAKIRMDFMALRYVLRGWRWYKAPKGRLKVKYGFRRAYGEERLFKEVREDVHFLSDSALVDKVIPLLEHKIFPIFRKKWKERWIMKDN